MHLLEAFADQPERFAEALLERALELLVYRRSHLLELGRVVVLDGLEAPIHSGPHTLELLLHENGHARHSADYLFAERPAVRRHAVAKARVVVAKRPFDALLRAFERLDSRHHRVEISGLKNGCELPEQKKAGDQYGCDGSQDEEGHYFHIQPSASMPRPVSGGNTKLWKCFCDGRAFVRDNRVPSG